MARFHTSRTFDLLFVLTLAVVIGGAALNRTTITDSLFFWQYTPDAKTTLIATDAGLSDTGRHLLYRTNPKFDTKTAVDAHCDTERLGCLTRQGQAFIYDDSTRPQQTIVTATHEMLHLAYRRLPQSQKDTLAPLLNQAVEQNAILGTEAELDDQPSPEDRLDEAHALLGTEYQHLPPALEDYYRTYFTDRSKVVQANQGNH
ncbi:MAG TPA: hypothetical protein VMT30_01465 [Candidatus Saccharimonadia bacterium]|nr:hypothetical protein [Candidatus Saccharimonadia bacterium]